MANHNDTGNKGEMLAAQYLISHGFEILSTNWHSQHREVDIIARKNGLIVFVEVKTRSSDQWQRPEESVDARKQKLLIEAAGDYMANYPDDAEARFDVVSVVLNANGDVKITHFPEAFIPELS
ncbi:MAG: YraN family protein [Bacteroidales bacterium]|nr:YraN family protein [Bacteroidales bacterium]HOY38316.1 YraN family protein [Bacteroidales bacterium]HQP04623.1 YraN family protein [Bacteroidales bacterium]